jgi:hypothetical protein
MDKPTRRQNRFAEGCISKLRAVGYKAAPFPLTLTLSLGERESPLAVADYSKGYCVISRGGFLV